MQASNDQELETYHFSFFGRPYTMIRAETVSIIPTAPGERAMDVKFDQGRATVRILIDMVTTTLVGFGPQDKPIVQADMDVIMYV